MSSCANKMLTQVRDDECVHTLMYNNMHGFWKGHLFLKSLEELADWEENYKQIWLETSRMLCYTSSKTECSLQRDSNVYLKS